MILTLTPRLAASAHRCPIPKKICQHIKPFLNRRVENVRKTMIHFFNPKFENVFTFLPCNDRKLTPKRNIYFLSAAFSTQICINISVLAK